MADLQVMFMRNLFFRSFDWLTVTMKCWRLLSSFLTKPCFEQNRSFCFIHVCSSGLHDINVINIKQKQMFTSSLIISDCAILLPGAVKGFEVWNFVKLCFWQIVGFYTFHIDYKGYWMDFLNICDQIVEQHGSSSRFCSSEFWWGSTIHACASSQNRAVMECNTTFWG
jgi:hypothetical protein